MMAIEKLSDAPLELLDVEMDPATPDEAPLGSRDLADALRERIEGHGAFDPVALAVAVNVTDGRLFRCSLWRAVEDIRIDTGAVYVPMGNGFYMRATAEQKAKRGRRFSAAARRKLTRGAQIIESVNELDVPLAERGSLRRSKEKLGRLAALANAIVRGAVSDPKESVAPKVPRGR